MPTDRDKFAMSVLITSRVYFDISAIIFSKNARKICKIIFYPYICLTS